MVGSKLWFSCTSQASALCLRNIEALKHQNRFTMSDFPYLRERTVHSKLVARVAHSIFSARGPRSWRTLTNCEPQHGTVERYPVWLEHVRRTPGRRRNHQAMRFYYAELQRPENFEIDALLCRQLVSRRTVRHGRGFVLGMVARRPAPLRDGRSHRAGLRSLKRCTSFTVTTKRCCGPTKIRWYRGLR